jgi:hypothetical protein
MTDVKKEEINKQPVKKSISSTTEHLNANFTNYLLLFLAALSIGIISPAGLPRALLTVVVMYIYTFSIHCSATAFKPLADFLTKAGTTRLLNSELLGFSCTLGWLFWALIGNYLVHRFSGITILDNFIIIFWILLYSSIHMVNFLLLKKTNNGGRELTELLDIMTNKFNSDKVTNMGNPKLNILISAGIVISVIMIAKKFPAAIAVPESYLKSAEDTVLNFFFPNTTIPRHNMEL